MDWRTKASDPRLMAALVWTAILLYIVIFSYLTVLEHVAFETTAFDLGNMDQAVWNSLRGRLLPFTNWGEEGTRLAYHVDPILVLISPLYLLYSDPRTLLVLQTVVVALGAWPIYLLSRERLGSNLGANVFPLAYLLFPALQAANMFDFHPTTLVAGLFPYAFYFLEKRRYALFFLFTVLIMSCKEEMALLAVMLGLYALFWQRNWRVGTATIILGILWFVAAVYVIIPHYNPQGRSPYLGAYSHLGQGPLGILKTAVTDPMAVVQALSTRDKLVYLRDLLLPVGFLSLLGPQVLSLFLPSLGIILLSSDPQVYTLEKFHYASPLVPVVVLAAVFGMAFLSEKLAARSRIPRRRWLYLLSGLVLLSTLLYHRSRGFTPLGGNFTLPIVTAHDRLAEEFVSLVPEDAIVSAQSRLNPHVSQREKIYMFPRVEDAEYVFFDVTADSWPIHPNDQWRLYQSLATEEGFGVLEAKDGYILLRRGMSDGEGLPDSFYSFARREEPAIENPAVIEFGDVLRFLGFDLDQEGDQTSLSLYWQAMVPLERDYLIYPFFYDDGGRIIEDTTLRPMTTAIWYPTGLWKPQEIVCMETLPWDVGSDFRIGLGVVDGGSWPAQEQRLGASVVTSALRIRLFDEDTAVQLVEVRESRITTPSRLFALPDTAQPQRSALGEHIELLGYQLVPEAPSVGEAMRVRLYWQATDDVTVDYTVFTHLVDEDETIVAQHDGQPDGGRYPTSHWLRGEVVEDEHPLMFAPGYGPGEYTLLVGMYELESGERLPAYDEHGQPWPRRHVVLTTLQVEE
jgi:uncharacterized membrane protein